MIKSLLGFKYTFLYLSIAFGFAWVLWGSEILAISGNTNYLVEQVSRFSNFGAWGPFIAAIVVALLVKGVSGIKEFARSTISLKFKKIWLLPTIFIFPLIIGIPLLIAYVFEGSIPFAEAWINPYVLPIAFVFILLNAGPLQEEYGWRGTLQNQFQEKTNALFASLLVGIIWGLWHLPLFFIPEQGFYYDKPIWGLLISTTLISVLFGWIYNNTGKSMLLMLLFHTMYNFSHYIFPTLESELASLMYMIILGIIVLIVVVRNGITLKSK